MRFCVLAKNKATEVWRTGRLRMSQQVWGNDPQDPFVLPTLLQPQESPVHRLLQAHLLVRFSTPVFVSLVSAEDQPTAPNTLVHHTGLGHDWITAFTFSSNVEVTYYLLPGTFLGTFHKYSQEVVWGICEDLPIIWTVSGLSSLAM